MGFLASAGCGGFQHGAFPLLMGALHRGSPRDPFPLSFKGWGLCLTPHSAPPRLWEKLTDGFRIWFGLAIWIAEGGTGFSGS